MAKYALDSTVKLKEGVKQPSSLNLRDTHWLDGIRGLAALLVCFTHCFIIPMDENFSYWWAQPFGFLGAFAVATFIFLSGYCLALPTLKNSLKLKSFTDYITHRCNRIIPPYWGALVISIVLGVYVNHKLSIYDVQGLTPQVLWPIFLLHDWMGGSPGYNGPLWTLPIEFHIYFFLPIILWLMRSFGPLKGMIGWATLLLLLGHWFQGCMHFYAVFAIGVFTAWAINTPQPEMPSAKFCGAAALAGLVITVGLWTVAISSSADNRPWISVLWAISTMAGFAWIASPEGEKVRSLLSTGYPAMLGKQSYSLYLTHAPIIITLSYFLEPHLGLIGDSIAMVFLAIPMALLFSRGFWYVFERPYLEKRRMDKIADRTLDKAVLPEKSSLGS